MSEAVKKPNPFKMVALDPYLNVFKFSGRVARSTFWLHFVMANVISYVISTLAMPLFFDMKAMEEAVLMAETDPALMADVMVDFAKAAIPVTLISVLAFTAFPSMLIRRLHDSGKSGWWAAPYLIISAIGLVGSFTFASNMFAAISSEDVEAIKAVIFPALIFGAVAFFVMVLTIILACQKSDPEANRYGEPPIPAMG